MVSSNVSVLPVFNWRKLSNNHCLISAMVILNIISIKVIRNIIVMSDNLA